MAIAVGGRGTGKGRAGVWEYPPPVIAALVFLSLKAAIETKKAAGGVPAAQYL